MGFTVDIEPRYGEIGPDGDILRPVWLAYLDDAATRFFEWLGAPINQPPEQFDFSVVRAEVDILGTAGLRDLVVIHVTPSSVGRSSFALRYLVEVGSSTVLKATLTYVCVMPTEVKSRPIPQPVRELLCSSSTPPVLHDVGVHPTTPSG